MTKHLTMPQIAERMFNTPLMIEATKAEVIAQAFAPRVLAGDPAAEVEVLAGIAEDHPEFRRSAGSILNEGLSDYLIENRRGYIKHQSVAVIEVVGTLVRRGSWLGQSSGMTSYEGLRAQLKAAAADDDMKAIALEIDSPGGEAAGCFELATLVAEIRSKKPVYAFCAEYAYSAAYAIASQANYIVVPEHGGAGSIGVIMLHVEQSAKLKKEGLTVTVIRSGSHKAEGNSVEPLSDRVRKAWQSESDKMRATFCEVVAAGRGSRLTVAQAFKTEAQAFTGPEAVRLGLADAVANPKTAFDAMVAAVNSQGSWDGTIPARTGTQMSSSGCTTGARTPNSEEADMADKTTTPETQEHSAKAGPSSETQVPAATPGADAQQATDAERDRAAKITAACAKAGLSADFASSLVASGKSLEDASMAIIDQVAKKAKDGGDIQQPSVKITADGVDRMKAGMVEALSAKAGLKGGKNNEFTSMSLRELARQSLLNRGLSIPAGGAMMMVGAAFAPSMAGAVHTTSDFGEVLANIASKSMLKGFEESPETFNLWTSVGVLTDFKTTKRVGLSAFSNLDLVPEGSEFKYGTMGDHAEAVTLATYGKMFAISRQAVINDDLSAFTKTPALMGRAAKRTVGTLAYQVLTANAAMGDGTALFHADHNNLAGAGAAPSEVTLNAGINAMMTQKDRSGTAFTGAVPKFGLFPVANRSVVLQALNSEYAPDDTDKAGSAKMPRAYNTTRNAVDPIFEPRLTGTDWFLAADPNMHDTVEISYLDGVQEPWLEQQQGWTVDGTEFKVRIDAAAKALAWEGLYKNPGA